MTPARARRELAALRKAIDAVDDGILKSLGRRRELVLRLAKAKKVLSIPIHAPGREKALVERVKALGKRRKLNPEFVEVVFRLIVMNSKEVQFHEAQ